MEFSILLKFAANIFTGNLYKVDVSTSKEGERYIGRQPTETLFTNHDSFDEMAHG